MICLEIIGFEFPCVAGAQMTNSKHEELVLAWNCFKSPNPFRIKLVPAKVPFEDLLYRTHVIDLVGCVCLQFNRQFLWEKRCFEKQSVRCLSCIPKPDLHLGKTCFIKQVFRCVLRPSLCLFLRALRVCHLVCYESCFDKICAEIAACRRILDSIFTFVTLYLSRFFDIALMFSRLYSKRWEIVKQC